MPSPFPGMDPWLESPEFFGDLHDSLIFLMQDALQPVLPPGYTAQKRARVWLETPERLAIPDVSVAWDPSIDSGESRGVATIAETGPMVVAADPLPDPEEFREPYLEIYRDDAHDPQLVTSIEVLSPTNKKPGIGRNKYVAKQQDMFIEGVHTIEIDLLRAGRHATMIPEARLVEEAGEFDYHVCLHCADQRNRFYIYAFKLIDRVPEIAIPLLPEDPTLTLDLQPVFDRAYDAGGFAKYVKYRQSTPKTPLSEEQSEWTQQKLDAFNRTS